MSFQHKKSLGQNFLNSDYVPKKMCDAARIEAGDLVVEIGPGIGALTKELLSRGAKVMAIEADIRAIETLNKIFVEEIINGQLIINHADARNLDLKALGLQTQAFKVVSNIPYYLSGLLFRVLLDTDCQPSTLVFLVQKEVAERIARDPKESLLSLSIKVFGKPTYISTIKKSHFTPQPLIDSAIILIDQISRDNFNNFDKEAFFKLIHLGFAQKRKQLLGNLAAEFNRSLVEKCLLDLNLIPTVRAEDVPLETWLKLTKKLSTTVISHS